MLLPDVFNIIQCIPYVALCHLVSSCLFNFVRGFQSQFRHLERSHAACVAVRVDQMWENGVVLCDLAIRSWQKPFLEFRAAGNKGNYQVPSEGQKYGMNWCPIANR